MAPNASLTDADFAALLLEQDDISDDEDVIVCTHDYDDENGIEEMDIFRDVERNENVNMEWGVEIEENVDENGDLRVEMEMWAEYENPFDQELDQQLAKETEMNLAAERLLNEIASPEEIGREKEKRRRMEELSGEKRERIRLLEEVKLAKEKKEEERREKECERKKKERTRKNEDIPRRTNLGIIIKEFKDFECPETCEHRRTRGKSCLQVVAEEASDMAILSERTEVWVQNRTLQERAGWLKRRLAAMSVRRENSNAKHARVQYTFAQTAVCKTAFIVGCGLTPSFMKTHMAQFRQGNVSTPEHANTGRPRMHSASFSAERWMESFFESCKEESPEHPDFCWIPCCYTKEGVYTLYKEEMEKQGYIGREIVSKSCFMDIWGRNHPDVRVTKPNKWAKCDKCVSTVLAMKSAKNNAQRNYVRVWMAVHTTHVR